MTAPLAMLTLYGALDLAVERALESDDPTTAVIVEQYLPGAVENRGWSQELHDLFLPDRDRITTDGFGVTAALEGLLQENDRTDRPVLTIPDMANLIYVIGALQHTPGVAAEVDRDLAAQVLLLATPEEGLSGQERLELAYGLLDGMYQAFSGWQSWPDFITAAAAAGYVLDLVAKVPQCRTAVVTVNGLECVVLDADIESDTISFDDVIAVADPRNWPKTYPSFFCHMTNFVNRVPNDGWYNIVETAGFCYIPGGYALTQRLRFLKTDQATADARLDFDLAENQDGDGCNKKVLVDRGFINVSCTRLDGRTDQGGVRIESRKVAHVTDISPYAQAFWLCKLGYGWAAVQLFFGPAQKPPAGYVGWKSPPYLKEPSTLQQSPSGAQNQGGSTTQSGGTAPSNGKPQVSTKTAKALADVAKYVTTTNLDITKKWLAGQLSFGDLAKYGQDVGGRLASEPWKWLADITSDTTSGGSSGGSGGGAP